MKHHGYGGSFVFCRRTFYFFFNFFLNIFSVTILEEMKTAYNSVYGCAETLVNLTNIHTQYLDVLTAKHQNEVYTSDIIQRKLDEVLLQLNENAKQNSTIISSVDRVMANQETMLAKLNHLEELVTKSNSNVMSYQIVANNNVDELYQQTEDQLIIFNAPTIPAEQNATIVAPITTVSTENDGIMVDESEKKVIQKRNQLSDTDIDKVITEVNIRFKSSKTTL